MGEFLVPDGNVFGLEPRGLHFIYPGCRLSFKNLVTDRLLIKPFLRDDHGAWYVLWSERPHPDPSVSNLDEVSSMADELLTAMLRNSRHEYAMIIDGDFPAPGGAASAVLVRIRASQEGIRFVKRVALAKLVNVETSILPLKKYFQTERRTSEVQTSGEKTEIAAVEDLIAEYSMVPEEAGLGLNKILIIEPATTFQEDFEVVSCERLPSSQRWCME